MSKHEIRVLAVDDDAALHELLRDFFKTRSVRLSTLNNANNLTDVVARERPSIIVLDVMMPGVDGLSALKALRASSDTTPVIMMTGRAEIVDRVIGLELGADDYISKPFLPQELSARIHAILRRNLPVSEPCAQRFGVYRFGRFELDLDAHLLRRDGEPVRLMGSELTLLGIFVRHPMETLSRARILFLSHTEYADVNERSIDVPIWRLRQVIEDEPSHPRIIHTMRGIGYMFVPPGSDANADSIPAPGGDIDA
jgi:two-component system phosphate regulon response regulator OmpR